MGTVAFFVGCVNCPFIRAVPVESVLRRAEGLEAAGLGKTCCRLRRYCPCFSCFLPFLLSFDRGLFPSAASMEEDTLADCRRDHAG